MVTRWGQAVAGARAALGLSLREAQRATGLAAGHLGRLEQPGWRYAPRPQTITALARLRPTWLVEAESVRLWRAIAAWAGSDVDADPTAMAIWQAALAAPQPTPALEAAWSRVLPGWAISATVDRRRVRAIAAARPGQIVVSYAWTLAVVGGTALDPEALADAIVARIPAATTTTVAAQRGAADDGDLALILAEWPALPPRVRRALADMVRAWRDRS